MKKLIVVYRDNELFNKYVPTILSHVPGEFVVEKLVYKAGTKEDEIALDLVPKLKAITGSFSYLSDKTCAYTSLVYEALRDKVKNGQIIILKKTLDIIFQEAVEEAVIGGEALSIKTEENFKIVTARVINLLVPTGPRKIIVVTDCIASHLDTDAPLGKVYIEEKEDSTIINHNGFATFIKGAVKEYFPSAEVLNISSFRTINNSDLTDSSTVIIVDRHHGDHAPEIFKSMWKIDKWPHAARLFLLPFENTLAHLEELGKVEVDFDGQSLFNRLDLTN